MRVNPKINIPTDKFHCVHKGYGRLIAFIPFKGWVGYFYYYGFGFIPETTYQPRGEFHNCRVTGVY